jgi:hypothetical protein
MYQVAEALCQLSICAFYLRIMTNPKVRTAVWVLIGLVVCFGVGNTFAMVFNCTPIEFFWNGWRRESTGKCIDIRLFGFIRGGIEIALDLAILTLPLPMLYQLQMSMRKKAQIISMFCIGFVITVVSCLRIHGLIQFGQTQNPTCMCPVCRPFALANLLLKTTTSPASIGVSLNAISLSLSHACQPCMQLCKGQCQTSFLTLVMRAATRKANTGVVGQERAGTSVSPTHDKSLMTTSIAG